jgi:thiamine biosynthesis lipoprotein
MSDIHVFNHHAMATHFEVRIAGEERTYAAQTARAAFDLLDELEGHLSRFRAGSDICRLADLIPGESLRVSEPVFACLEIARKMEKATLGAFSATPAARQTQLAPPQWSLHDFSVSCEAGKLEMDLGAIGKGFALDRLAQLLREWSCPAFLLVAGGSSVLAGESPPGLAGWSCGLGDDHSPHRYCLENASLSGSGLAVKGQHILDPHTGRPAPRENRAWALCDTAAESDALSTAAMVLGEPEINQVLAAQKDWLILLDDHGSIRCLGYRPLPEPAP